MLLWWCLEERELEPITHEVVVSMKENPMTIENDALCEDLRAWIKSPAVGLPEYLSDPGVQRRVGRMLANFNARFARQAQRRLVVNSIQTRLPDKP
jgi:regulator of sirC expression with transglutaminase-like and TPR domain